MERGAWILDSLIDWREVWERDRWQGVSNILDLNNWKVEVLVLGCSHLELSSERGEQLLRRRGGRESEIGGQRPRDGQAEGTRAPAWAEEDRGLSPVPPAPSGRPGSPSLSGVP